MNYEKIYLIINNFFNNSNVLNIESIDSGLVNKTYIIEYLSNGKKSKSVLQCLGNIFVSHEIVNSNHNLITDHIKKKIKMDYSIFDYQRWEVPSLIKCESNKKFIFAYDSNFWRVMEYINDTASFDILEDNGMAYQTGVGLAKFHKACRDIDFEKLEKSINNFHDTNHFIEKLNESLNHYNFKKLDINVRKRVKKLIYDLSKHIKNVRFILGYLKKKIISSSLIHGDPKLSNFLFDSAEKYVVSLIDLDTVSSGYLLTDLADCIRSICNVAGEDPIDIDKVYFDIECCNHFLNGYFSISDLKVDCCFGLLPEFIYMTVVELIIRFLNDFLQSNIYFKVKYKTQNLYRAEVQYQLLSSFVSQIPSLSILLNEFGISTNSTFVSDIQNIV